MFFNSAHNLSYQVLNGSTEVVRADEDVALGLNNPGSSDLFGNAMISRRKCWGMDGSEARTEEVEA